MTQKVYIASDHAGLDLKNNLLKKVSEIDPPVELHDLGPDSYQRVDYPQYAKKVAKKITEEPKALGVLICGSGIGMSIAANKFEGVRAAHVSDPVSAQLAKNHNNANILCMGGRFLAPEYALEILKAWIQSQPPTEESRHQSRIQQIHSFEPQKGADYE